VSRTKLEEYSSKSEECAVHLRELNLRVEVSHGNFVVEEKLEVDL
jgi:hypothetical protein